MNWACVPLPAPGGPSSMILTMFSYKLPVPKPACPVPLHPRLIRMRGRVLYLKYPARGHGCLCKANDSPRRDSARLARYLADSSSD